MHETTTDVAPILSLASLNLNVDHGTTKRNPNKPYCERARENRLNASHDQATESIVMRGDSCVHETDPTVVMRGGASRSFDHWSESLDADGSQNRCEIGVQMEDVWDDHASGWDAEFVTETLLDAVDTSGCSWDRMHYKVSSLQTEVRPHRREPLPSGGCELLVCSLRQFTFFASVRNAEGRLVDVPELRLRVSLVYANDGSPVEVRRLRPQRLQLSMHLMLSNHCFRCPKENRRSQERRRRSPSAALLLSAFESARFHTTTDDRASGYS